MKREHLDDLRNYQRALKQRNRMLREARGDPAQVAPGLSSWTDRLLEFARRADLHRREYLAALQAHVQDVMRQLDSDLRFDLSYEQGWPEGAELEETLGESVSREVKLGATQNGPHRADLRIEVPGGRAADILSRGQAKVLASSLHVAQARKTREQTGAESLFLIDDVGAELDEAHRQRFFQLLSEEDCQIMTTGTASLAEVPGYGGDRFRAFHVEHGVCQPAEI